MTAPADEPHPSGRPLPTGRWRRAGSSTRGAADRVKRAHAQARRGLRMALCFIGSAAVAAVLDGTTWLAVHLFLAGGMLLAISSVSLMLTVTWAAAPAPPDRLVIAQQLAAAVGAAGVGIGRRFGLNTAVVGAAGTIYLAALVGLAALLVTTARRGVERRFDPAVAAYVTALAFGFVGVALGIASAIGTSTAPRRSAHVTVNVLGLVGLVIAGTLPFFAATVGRARMARHATPARLYATTAWLTAALAAAAAATLAGHYRTAGVALIGYAAGILAVLWLAPRPTRRQLRWAGPRLVALWAGAGWWTSAVVTTAVALLDGHAATFGRPWLAVLVVAGYAQILWGSLAYLLPMLRGGGHELLGAGFATTRSWLGLVAANVAGVALVADAAPVAAGSIAVWVLDATSRAVRVGIGGAARRPPGDVRPE